MWKSYSFIDSNAVWPCWPYGVILGLDEDSKIPALQKKEKKKKEYVYVLVGNHEFETLDLAFLSVHLPEDIFSVSKRGKIGKIYSESKMVLFSLSRWSKEKIKCILYFKKNKLTLLYIF